LDARQHHTGTASADGNTWTNVSGTALAASTQYHQVVVDGTASDGVTLAAGIGMWANAGTVSNGTSNYTVWQNDGAKSQVLVKSGVTVTNNDTTTPVVIDLNRDGILGYGQVTMDVNGDGHLDTTKWAGAQDGVLVWDKFADGLVHDNSQYAFAQYATTYSNGLDSHGKTATDLSGLADAFDTNHDGKFNTADAKFSELKVWQDVNQNGVSDAGEVRSLADWGIAEINLSSDGVVRTPTAGVTEAGRTTATATDGTQVLVSDAGFEFSSLAYSVSDALAATNITAAAPVVKLNLLGANTHLDLSSFTAMHPGIAQVNVSGAGANTLKINLKDVLQGTPAGTLEVTGDADDTALFAANEWTSSASVVVNNGHTYAVYSAVNGAAAQLLIDQQMLQHAV